MKTFYLTSVLIIASTSIAYAEFRDCRIDPLMRGCSDKAHIGVSGNLAGSHANSGTPDNPGTGGGKTNHGNHYGNDKPDNNPRDTHNSHNGEQSKADHHDNNGNH